VICASIPSTAAASAADTGLALLRRRPVATYWLAYTGDAYTGEA
jgi:hypothetical protein